VTDRPASREALASKNAAQLIKEKYFLSNTKLTATATNEQLQTLTKLAIGNWAEGPNLKPYHLLFDPTLP
jgi:hypothetical protein